MKKKKNYGKLKKTKSNSFEVVNKKKKRHIKELQLCVSTTFVVVVVVAVVGMPCKFSTIVVLTHIPHSIKWQSYLDNSIWRCYCCVAFTFSFFFFFLFTTTRSTHINIVSEVLMWNCCEQNIHSRTWPTGSALTPAPINPWFVNNILFKKNKSEKRTHTHTVLWQSSFELLAC